MSFKIPQIIGHRGACGYAPENTLESIRTAADMGVKWVELDVMLTKDLVPIIFHDDTLERTTNGSGNVADHTWESLQALEAGEWFSEGFSGVRIPTLEEAVDTIIEMGLGLNLEIKPTPGKEIETAEVALDCLSRIWDDRDNLLISSFQHTCLETALDMAPDWRRGLLLWHDDMPENWKEVADYLDVSSVNISNELATPEFIAEILETEKPLVVYTINDADRARELQRLGVRSFFTDVPDVLDEALLKIH